MKNYSFKHVFGILIKFPIQQPEKHYKIWYSKGEKRCQSLNCQKHSLKEQSGTKSLVKSTWSDKMTVLSTFLESLLNFLSNNQRNNTKFGTVREKSDVKI